MANDEQARAWNGDDGRHWVDERERYERMQGRLTERLAKAAAVQADHAVLDIGCGTGGNTRTAARTASRGRATGVDISATMLTEARRVADAEGLANVTFEEADAQTSPLPEAAFDVVISKFGVMFFEDPDRAFGNIAASLRPGGRLAFLCWQPAADNEFLTLPFGAMAAHVALPEQPVGDDTSGAFSLADPDRVRTLLTGVGLTDVTIEDVREPLWTGRDADDVLAFYTSMPFAQSMLAGVSDERTAETVRAALRDALESRQGPEGVELGSAAWLVTARR
ncbi:methyltransferase domain-containing protein [Spirillospora sp. NPDC052269]